MDSRCLGITLRISTSPPGGSSCHHIGTSFDLVGNDRVVGAVHHIHPVDFDDIGTGAADIGTHRVEEVSQIHNVRLLGHIFHDGDALGLDGS